MIQSFPRDQRGDKTKMTPPLSSQGHRKRTEHKSSHKNQLLMERKSKINDSSGTKDGLNKERRQSRSSWAKAPPRFLNEPVLETNGGGLHTMQTDMKSRREMQIKRPSQVNSKVRTESREINLTPPKAKELVKQMISVVNNDDPSFHIKSNQEHDDDDFTHLSEDCHDELIHQRLFDNFTKTLVSVKKNNPKGNKMFFEGADDDDDDDDTVNMSLHIMESKLGRLEKQIKERDKQIDSLKGNCSVTKEDFSHVMEGLEMAARLLNDQRFREARDHEQEMMRIRAMEKERREDLRCLSDTHKEEILQLREDQKRYFVDLQNRLLEWMGSRSDLVEQSIHLKYELHTLRQDYENLKASSIKAFQDAAQSIQENCETLQAKVKEEIRESEESSRQKMSQLEKDLVQARERIAELEQLREKQSDHNAQSIDYDTHEPQTSVSSLDAQSVHQYSTIGDHSVATDWNDFSSRFREALDGRVPTSDNSSVNSKLDLYATTTAEKLFKNLYSKPKPRRMKQPSHSSSAAGNNSRLPTSKNHHLMKEVRSPNANDFHDCDEE
jgi:hypothetical protein